MQTGLCRHVSLSPATCHPLKIHGPCHAMPCPGWQCLGPTRPAGMTMGQAGPCWPTGQKPFSFKSSPKKQQYIITYSLQVILTFFSWDIEKETVVGKRGPTLSFFAVSRKKPMAGRNPLQGNQPAHCSMILHLITTKPSSHTNQLEPRPCTYPVNPTKTFNYSSNPPTDPLCITPTNTTFPNPPPGRDLNCIILPFFIIFTDSKTHNPPSPIFSHDSSNYNPLHWSSASSLHQLHLYKPKPTEPTISPHGLGGPAQFAWLTGMI